MRWRQSLEALSGRGATVVAELGPGGVLTGMVRRTIPDVRGVAVAVPADLDKLMDTVAGSGRVDRVGPRPPGRAPLHLRAGDREPGPGRVRARRPPGRPGEHGPGRGHRRPGQRRGHEPGSLLAVGDRVGTVGLTDVRTPFDGILVRWLAVRGERVVEGQPVAWIRTRGSGS